MDKGFRRLAVFFALVTGLLGLFIDVKNGAPAWVQGRLASCDWFWIVGSFLGPAAVAWIVVFTFGWTVAGFVPCFQQNREQGSLPLYNGLLLTINGVMAILIVGFLATRGIEHSQSSSFSQTDILTIILTALGVMLTALVISLGVLGVIGFAGIRNEARRIALAETKKHFAAATKDDPRPPATPATENMPDSIPGDQDEGDNA
jgi:hypothetical protein